ncbi:MAG TPA: flagellar cap protein FliD N-terminal domain-containing protein, partial [Savagea sp.]
MRISGLASGIDTESIINDMMRAHRLPLNKITQKKQYLEWQLDDYRSINRDLRKRSDDLFDSMLRSSAAFNKKTVNISNPDAISIKGDNAANNFAGTIQVTQLAKQASIQSGGKLEATGKQK